MVRSVATLTPSPDERQARKGMAEMERSPHCIARRKQLKSANAAAGNVVCVRLAETNEENLNTFFLRAFFYDCDIS